MRGRHLQLSICITFVCHLHVVRMCSYVICMLLECQSYITRISFLCYSYVLVSMYSNVVLCHSYVIRMSLVCILSHSVSLVSTRLSLAYTRMSFVCHSYVLVCTRMSFVCHSYTLVCHSYVTRIYSYVIRMSLVCISSINLLY